MNKHLKLRIMRGRAVEGLTVRDSDTSPLMNSHRVQDAPLNNLDEVHKWMQLHKPEATDDMECGNLEFLYTLNTPSPERMRHLLDLCKDNLNHPSETHCPRDPRSTVHPPLLLGRGEPSDGPRRLVGASSL